MILESIFGLFLMVAGGGDKSVDPTSAIIKGIKQVNKVQEKKKADELNATIREDKIYITGGEK
tara:strand:+ start:421 stop:609 length:189 start_codon:yes stop_codon:yes gene_type:complete